MMFMHLADALSTDAYTEPMIFTIRHTKYVVQLLDVPRYQSMHSKNELEHLSLYSSSKTNLSVAEHNVFFPDKGFLHIHRQTVSELSLPIHVAV